MKNLQSDFGPQITKYLDYRTALGFSRLSDGRMLAKFDKYCCTNYPDVNELTREIVWAWIESENTSIPNKATAIRNFAKYLQAHGSEAYEFMASVHNRQKARYSPYMFTSKELRALFLAAQNIKPRSSRPHLAVTLPVMLRLIYSCGLRPNEARELLRDNIDFTTGAMKIVNTKGKKERTVVMSDDMLKLAISYDEKRKEFAGVNPYFFPAEGGGVYSDTVIQKWLKECWAAANPNIPAENLPSVRVYDLRHVFATSTLTRFIERGENIKSKLSYLQAYMGHDTVKDTMYYVHFLPETLLSGGKWDTLPESAEMEAM